MSVMNRYEVIRASEVWNRKSMSVKVKVWLSALVSVAFFTLSGCGSIHSQHTAKTSPDIGGTLAQQASSQKPQSYHAVVNGSFTGKDGDETDGMKTYKTVQSAINAIPSGRTEPFKILVKNGTYYEKLLINKPFISLIGEDQEKTILTYDATAGTKKPDGTDYGTSGSASVTVKAANFRADNMTISNSFDYITNMKKANDDPTKQQGTQAVALSTDSGSNHSVFKNVKITGFQDTLLVNAGMNYFDTCTIEGTVDFIFGRGQAVFNHCDIVSQDLGSKSNNGYITAASTLQTQQYGFLIINSKLLKKNPSMADGTVALGRPWHPGGDPNAVGSVVFKNCFMDSHISAKGWESMSGFAPEDARMYEYGSTGPGAILSKTRRVLTDSAAQEYTPDNVLQGWNPDKSS